MKLLEQSVLIFYHGNLQNIVKILLSNIAKYSFQ